MSQTGLDWKLYRNTGTNASPAWVAVGRAENVNCPLTKSMAAVPRKESRWNRSIGALKDGPLEFGYVYKNGTDAALLAFLNSFANNVPIQLACVDGEIDDNDTFGFKAWYECSDFPLDQPLQDGVKLALKFSLADYEESGVLIEPDFVGYAGDNSSSSPGP